MDEAPGRPDLQPWVMGDHHGLALPATPAALRAGGPEWLTRALHAGGVLAAGNRVTAITRLDEWPVGGTGTKAMLSLAYAQPQPGLAPDLFVKFSRNATDPVRDRVRWYMEPEVRLALLSRDPAFPVAVPACLHADYHRASGTGLIISERIAYGEGAVEPHWPKCMDHRLPDALAHYEVLVATLAHLSGTHRSGRLAAIERAFPFDREQALAARRGRHDSAALAERIGRMAQFITRHPHLFPAHLADPAFLAGLCADAPLAVTHQDAIARFQLSAPEMIALCHWNANIDNAWFWRNPAGALNCGLIDWGAVGQMPVAGALWGALSACEADLLDDHLAALVALFAEHYARAGGPRLDPDLLQRHVDLAVIGTACVVLATAPRAILSEIPDPALLASRHDPALDAHETARVQLKIAVNCLNLWHRRDLGGLLRSGRFA
ncbi:hypothetical protein ACFOD9_10300 [Novosphingobium bradum]|uniref:Aminoglycoside phosphotransferase domain-containing protein n=1 Tax=Novosphingobium bradum TaxID=1737444 RepID=A0ABV7IUM5_9SPHN